MEGLGAALLDAGEIRLAVRAKTQLAGNDLLGEIAFADEEWHNENAGRENSAQDAGNARFEFPKAFDDLAEDFAAAQFIGVLIGGRAGIGVEGRAVARQNQRGIGEFTFTHGLWLTEEQRKRKLALVCDERQTGFHQRAG
jgi:hypothetical protein